MRIRLYATPEVRGQHPYCDFVDMMSRDIVMSNGCVVTDVQPDIVHIIGCWDNKAFRIAREMFSMRIPYICSTMEGLMPWNREKWSENPLFNTRQKKTITHAALIQTGGELEEMVLKELGWNQHIHIIANPLTTNCVTEEKTAQELISSYEYVIKEHELMIRQEIEQEVNSMSLDNEDARKVMKKFLYARYLCRRKMIPQAFLDEFSQTLKTTDFDEDLMGNMLHKNNLLILAARLEQIMADESSLTDGFMPIPARSDKETDKIKTYITNYQ